MRKLLLALVPSLLAVLALAAPAAAAEFGLNEFEVSFTDESGQPVTQAGSHPYLMTTSFRVNTETNSEGTFPVESSKDVMVALAPGFVGDLSAVPQCAALDFLVQQPPLVPGTGRTPSCPDGTAVGLVTIEIGNGEGVGAQTVPLYNLEPVPGKAARLGFVVQSVPVTVDVGLSQSPPYNVIAAATNISQALEVFGTKLEVWGYPADPAHNEERGRCYAKKGPVCPPVIDGEEAPELPFLTLPRSCDGALQTHYQLDSWQRPGIFTLGEATTPGMSGCAALGFSATTSSRSTTPAAESASGVDYGIGVSDPGLKDPEGRANADITSLRTVFPPGVTVNPSAANGLGACTPVEFEAASLGTAGCPEDAKVGTMEVETPVLQKGKVLHGIVYVAQPDDPATTQPGSENPFDSLLALYLVVRDPQLGVFIKLPAKVEADERTGQLTTTVEGLPQFPLGHVEVHLRPGPRAPLVTPQSCGRYTTTTTFFPSSGGQALTSDSSIVINSGIGGSPCPPAGPQPFDPGFTAGSEGNTAGSFSPFLMRFTRQDGQQEISRFQAALPPGVVPRLAGVAKCSDAQIAAARASTGRAELAAASCPSGSQIGTVTAGAGIGQDLTYVDGKVYLAGPYDGDPLSAVAVVPAVAGPFDLGDVVTRTGLRLNPETYVGEVNLAAAEAVPHILRGVPLRLRDLRVNVDRPGFMLAPTNCQPLATNATIFGSFLDPLSTADDISVMRSAPYQARNCAALGFKPKLTLRLKGATRRTGHPSLRSVITYPQGPGYANIGKAVVILPPSQFIDQARISNPCTRPAFAAGNCPPGSILGHARATTPLLDEPLEGLVYFRSNGGERELPDLVVDLHGVVNVILIGEIDSKVTKRNARLRTTFSTTPDAPITKFTLQLKGGKKGVLVNSRNLCKEPQRADVDLTGQNGRRYDTRRAIEVPGCKGKKKHHKNKRGHKKHHR